jgi:hypothetical protein
MVASHLRLIRIKFDLILILKDLMYMPKIKDSSTDDAQFHPFLLLGVILGVTAVIAVICYGLQIYYLGTN